MLYGSLAGLGRTIKVIPTLGTRPHDGRGPIPVPPSAVDPEVMARSLGDETWVVITTKIVADRVNSSPIKTLLARLGKVI